MISPEEAILIIKGWQDEQTELLLSATMINFSVLSKCRVKWTDSGKIVLWSVGTPEVVFSFSVDSPLVSLRFSGLREFKGKPGLENVPDDHWDKSALSVTLPLAAVDPSFRGARFDVEQIFILEL